MLIKEIFGLDTVFSSVYTLLEVQVINIAALIERLISKNA